MKIASRDPILEEIEPESIYRLKIKQYRKRVSYKPHSVYIVRMLF